MSTLTPMTQLSKRLDAFEVELAQKVTRQQTKLYASSYADCGRMQAYRILGYTPTQPETITPSYKRDAAFGDSIHSVIQQRLVESGMADMIPNFDYDEKIRNAARAKGELSPAIEVPLNEWTLTPEKFQEYKLYKLGGRVDAILKGRAGQIVLEIKTISGKYFQNGYRQYYNDKLYHYETQVQIYLHFLGVEQGVVLVVNRDNSSFDEYRVTYDPLYIGPALERLEHLNAVIMKAELPEPEPTRGPCKFCSYRDLCPSPDK